MKIRFGSLLLTLALLASALHASAALVISEVLYNEVGSDTGGEWIEIYNSGPGAIDLTNYKIGDEETSGGTGDTEGMFQFPGGASIGAGAVQIVAVDADDFFTNYGFLPAYEISGANATIANLTRYAAWDPETSTANTINLSNANDQALILDGSDAVVDALNWGNTVFLNPGLNPDAEADGQSYERINATVDTNTAADWKLGSPSSPGTVPVPEPASALLAAGAAAWAMGSVRRRGSHIG